MYLLGLAILIKLGKCYEKLPGYTSADSPEIDYNGSKLKFGMGSVKNSYGSAPYLQIIVGNGMQLRVPKAFYHYSERDLGADAKWGVPSGGRLMALNSLVKSNQKEINGMYLPVPKMDPINLHFVTQRTFEKGIDMSAHDGTTDGTLEAAKRICAMSSDNECEKALLRYYRLKVNTLHQQSRPLHQQLLHLGDLFSYSKLRDHEGSGMGVVVGVPGYDPLYVGAAMDAYKDNKLGVRFLLPE